MPYANNNGVKIYYEVEGQGPPLVLAHGGGSDLNRWRAQGYAQALKDDYKLILFDARGHGQSDKPENVGDYGSPMVGDVVTLLDTLDIRKANYWGYSMGAMTGFRAAMQHPDRFTSFVLGGMSPYRSDAEAKAAAQNLEGFKQLLADPQAYLSQRERTLGRTLTTEERTALLATPVRATIALLSTIINEPLSLTDHDLSLISVPVLLYAGDLDFRHPGAKESANHIPNATFFSLPGLKHDQVSTQADLIVSHVKEFLAKVNENRRRNA